MMITFYTFKFTNRIAGRLLLPVFRKNDFAGGAICLSISVPKNTAFRDKFCFKCEVNG